MHAIIIFIMSNYIIHVVETLGMSRCMASLDSKDFASLSNELILMFNKSYKLIFIDVNKDYL